MRVGCTFYSFFFLLYMCTLCMYTDACATSTVTYLCHLFRFENFHRARNSYRAESSTAPEHLYDFNQMGSNFDFELIYCSYLFLSVFMIEMSELTRSLPGYVFENDQKIAEKNQNSRTSRRPARSFLSQTQDLT